MRWEAVRSDVIATSGDATHHVTGMTPGTLAAITSKNGSREEMILFIPTLLMAVLLG